MKEPLGGLDFHQAKYNNTRISELESKIPRLKRELGSFNALKNKYCYAKKDYQTGQEKLLHEYKSFEVKFGIVWEDKPKISGTMQNILPVLKDENQNHFQQIKWNKSYFY